MPFQEGLHRRKALLADVRDLDDRTAHRCSFLITSFSPDHTSSTAQTLTSTSPIGSAMARTVSSVMSVGTFDNFFGHDTQMAASRRIRRTDERRKLCRS